MTKWVYNFGKSATDGNSSLWNLLGGKGANLAEMSGIGLPVPPGFTISTAVCKHFYDHDKTYPDALDQQVRSSIAKIEAETGTAFADTTNPLLVSVRSGARASMPGMMDTVLNLGLNDATAAGLARSKQMMSASPTIAIAALSRCMVMSSWGLIMDYLRMRSRI